MKRHGLGWCVVTLILASCAVAADREQGLDLRRAVPPDAYLAVYGRQNPERDYQAEHWENVWKTVEETQIIKQAVKIVADRMEGEDLDQAKLILTELSEAVEPIDLEAFKDCKEIVYAQRMRVPAAQHLMVLRLTPEAAAGCETAIKNLLAIAEKYSGEEIPLETTEEGDAVITTLEGIPADVPFHPALVRLDDVLLFSTSKEMALDSLKMLTGSDVESKFDDPRLADALAKLPEPEDALAFYDGKLQFDQMRQLGDFIRQASGGAPEAERASRLMERIFDEVSIIDSIVTVEYTEGNKNGKTELGRLLPGAEDKLLAEVLGSGEAFDDWQTWVPADALSYSMNTGVNLHLAYKWIMAFVKENFPEAQPALDQFESFQDEHDIHLDEDILQAFSGEFVSVSFPRAIPSMMGGQESVTALRCQKPERTRQLLHRLFEQLAEIPAVKAQQIKLAESEHLEGFDVLKVPFLAAFQVEPVIGFRDGWMFLGSSAAAVQKVLDTRAGQAENIAQTEAFTRFGLEIEGPVTAIQYTDLAASTRAAATFLGQAGGIAQMVIGLAGVDADEEDLEPIREVFGLLPSVAKIVHKLDFYEAKLTVVQDGDDASSYLKRSVTLIRPISTD